MINRSKVGYLGGTFDPPHLGHAILAGEALCQLGLDEVMWLITPDPPHKLGREITPVRTRLEMLRLVTSRYDRFSISEVDLERDPPYYAADTVEILKNQQPGMELVYIIGEDSLDDLPKWYQPERFLAAIDQLAVAPRPGFNANLDALDKKLTGLQAKTVYLANVMVEISSSLIRARIGQRSHFQHFLAQEVAEYIEKYSLYQDE